MAPTLRVPVTDLRRRLGTRREIARRIRPNEVADLSSVAGTAVAGDGELALDVIFESVPEGVMVVGTLVAPWTAECRRCLNSVEGDVDIEVHELFEHDPTPGDTYPLDDETVDLEPMVRDLVLLSLPLSVLCRESCEGPDPERFPTAGADDPGEGKLGVGGDDSGHDADESPAEPAGDPRWAALDQLRFDD